MRHLLVGLSLLGLASLSHAELPLNGAAIYQELGKDKFLASLYVEAPSQSPAALYDNGSAKEIQIQLTSRYSKRRWVNLWMQSMAINNSNQKFSAVADSLVSLFEKHQGSLKANDVVTVSFSPDSNTSYAINGITLAEEQPAELFNLFLSAWIGRVPPSSGFRDAILGVSDSSALAGRIATIKPSDSRISAIEAWAAPEEEEEPAVEEAVAEAIEEQSAEQVADASAAETVAETTAEVAATATDAATNTATQAGTAATETAATKVAASSTDNVQVATAEQTTEAAEQVIDDATFEAEEEVSSISLDMILALKDYTSSSLRHLYKFIKYPKVAQRRGLEGQVRLKILLDREGNLLESSITDESQHSSLNKAAMKAVKKASPFAVVPESIQDEPLELTFPVTFRLQ